MNSPENKADKKRDEPKDRGTHREIAMTSEGIPEEGNPPSRKAAKRSRHSCLAVEEAHSDDLVGFSGERITPDRFVTLWVTIGNPLDTWNVKV
ncbi:hypothetical protein PIB30_104009 [Stylosanthes scabra]|uniref:Uncharacterized protein n=1 Tax=Stylosanthes scabra TaxID=79078 RepID=A0ABU6VYL2_9FABA|nr:hypothetical protein [Stylosanthes scabra]